MTSIEESLSDVPIIPLVQADDPAVAIATAKAVGSGGVRVIEIVLRSDRALDCLRDVAEKLPSVVTGAGTVLSASQAQAAIEHGAKFLVSPGLDDKVDGIGQKQGVPVYPGTMTASEMQRAHNLGLETVKFFPASVAGGAAAVVAFASVFRSMRFILTGVISTASLSEYLALPSVLACGGSWLTPMSAVETGDFDAITRLAREAVAISKGARPPGS